MRPMQKPGRTALIPAHAGVIPTMKTFTIEEVTYPRARGGDPTTRHGLLVGRLLSPRTRG